MRLRGFFALRKGSWTARSRFYHSQESAQSRDFANRPDERKDWLFVEMKYPSKREYINRIVKEITSRQLVYTRQGAFVLFVVYDPGRHIVNDDQFKADCGGMDGVWIEVVR